MVLFGLGVLLFAGFLVIGAILGWIAYTRSRDNQARLNRLEREWRELRGRLEDARAPSATPPPSMHEEVAVAPAVASPSPIQAPPPPPPMARPAEPPVPALEPVARPSPAAAAGWGSRDVESIVDEPPPSPGAGTERAAARTTRPAPARFDLERWLGVRGAAVLGGIFLIVAGFLFVQYSIDRGWLTPRVRLIAGAFTGLGCVALSFPLLRKGFGILSHSLTGAGLVILYAVAWAAHRLYGEIEFFTAFGVMVGVTVACALLSYRRSSQLIAVLGLVGGFATPLVLSRGSHSPLGLFGYALLLDLAFLFVAHRRRWPSIAMVGMAGSFVVLGIWGAARLDATTLGVALIALGVFGVLFAGFAAFSSRSDGKRFDASMIGALFLPFAFALCFSQINELGTRLAPFALLAAVMALAAGVLAVLQRRANLAFGAAVACATLIDTWVGSNAPLAPARTLEWTVCVLGLAALFHGIVEWQRRREALSEAIPTGMAAAVFDLGILGAAFFAPWQVEFGERPTWLAALVLLPLLLLRLRALGAHAFWAVLGALLAGSSLAVRSHAAHADWAGAGRGLLESPIAWVAAVGLPLLVTARCVPSERRRGAFVAAACFFPPTFLAITLRDASAATPWSRWLVGALAISVAMSLAANGARSALLFLIAALGWFASAVLTGLDPVAIAASTDWPRTMLVLAVGLSVLTLWPFAAPTAMAERAGPWRVAAVAALPWFIPLHLLVIERVGNRGGGFAAAGLALLLGVAALRLWFSGGPELDAAARKLERDPKLAAQARARSIARAWFGAMAVLYAAWVVPLHIVGVDDEGALGPDAEPRAAAIAAMLGAWGLILLWRRSDHRGLKYIAAALGLFATCELVLVHVFEPQPSSERWLINPRAYGYLLPAVASIAAAVAAKRLEIARLRGFESQALPRRFAPASTLLGVCGTVLLFAWVNLEVADANAVGAQFAWNLQGGPQQNLAHSLAWAVFALALLVLGVSRRLGFARWASLFLLLITAAKVFLLDLGDLAGLYRVASILGLAVSLLLVSFLYQRFVFRRMPKDSPEVPADEPR